jgi:hypothetical protein
MTLSRSNSPTPPWNEVLRACQVGDLDPCVFGAHIRLVTDRLEPRTVGLVLESGKRSADLAPTYVCTCGAIVLGGEGAIVIEDLATVTGAVRFVDVVLAALRQLRSELRPASEAQLRTVGSEIHADLMRRLCVHATRWNLPPYALLGKTRARPAKCWHRV